MNHKAVKSAIKLMQKVKEKNLLLDMGSYRCTEQPKTIKSIRSIEHDCGTTHCLAGYIALSPDFKKFGGKVEFSGVPYIESLGIFIGGVAAITKYFDIEEKEYNGLCCGYGRGEYYYGVSHVSEITIDMVIDKLEQLLIKYKD